MSKAYVINDLTKGARIPSETVSKGTTGRNHSLHHFSLKIDKKSIKRDF
jgi:hypothetical protein